MTAPRRRGRLTIAVAVSTVALLCWPTKSSGHVPLARAATSARLMARAEPAAHAATLACDPTTSLRPVGPPVVAPGSFMAKIRARGHLIAGVDQSTYHFGYLNPFDGQIEGFDIDMLHAVSAAIFGNPNKIRFVAISDAQRIPALRSGAVDIVAHTMTITCARLQQVDFSTVYFEAAQRILVLRGSHIEAVNDLYGRRVCATTGSTSLTYLRGTSVEATAVAVPYWTDCLVLLQQGDVAAISTDDSILAGLVAQDPYTEIVGAPLTREPYGLAISKQHPDFVRFVNAVLAKLRSDGQWAASYRRWIGSPVPAPPPARYQG